MSVQALAWAFAVRGVSPSEKLVLLALANYAGPDRRCWPSQETLAEDTELSERTVWGALKGLEARSILSRLSRKRSDGTRSTDVFTLNLDGEIADQPVANSANSTRKSCENQSQSLRNPVAAVATPTTFEPVDINHGGGLGAGEDWPVRDLVDELVDELVKAAESPWLDPAKTPGLITTAGIIGGWKTAGAGWHRDVLPVVIGLCRARREPVSSWRFFSPAIARAIADNTQTLKIPEPHERNHPDQRQTSRQDRIGRMLAGAMAAADQP